MSESKTTWTGESRERPLGRRQAPPPRAALDEAAKRRQLRKIRVHEDTIRRWRKGVDVPDPCYVPLIIDALYALKLYWVRTGRTGRPA